MSSCWPERSPSTSSSLARTTITGRFLNGQWLKTPSSTGNSGRFAMTLSDDLIKQIYFYTDSLNPKGPVGEVDILDFARKIEAVCKIEHAKEEHARCVEIVSHMNKEVAKALANQRP